MRRLEHTPGISLASPGSVRPEGRDGYDDGSRRRRTRITVQRTTRP